MDDLQAGRRRLPDGRPIPATHAPSMPPPRPAFWTSGRIRRTRRAGALPKGFLMVFGPRRSRSPRAITAGDDFARLKAGAPPAHLRGLIAAGGYASCRAGAVRALRSPPAVRSRGRRPAAIHPRIPAVVHGGAHTGVREGPNVQPCRNSPSASGLFPRKNFVSAHRADARRRGRAAHRENHRRSKGPFPAVGEFTGRFEPHPDGAPDSFSAWSSNFRSMLLQQRPCGLLFAEAVKRMVLGLRGARPTSSYGQA